MTAHVILIAATHRLTSVGIDEARLNAELLLAHVLGVPRLRMLVELRQEVDAPALDVFEAFLERRARHEPLQHITGRVHFLGHEIRVSPAALIPRPETEVLVQHALELIPGTGAGWNVMDFGTGTGCISISLAAARPGVRVHATDVSGAALELARENAVQHGLDGRIQFYLGGGFESMPSSLASKLDLVVSNPPYIPTGDIAELQVEVRDFDPRIALDGGIDGLDFFRRLAVETPQWLKPSGWLVAEFGDGQADPLRALFDSGHWTALRMERDLSGIGRVMLARRAPAAAT